MNSAVTRTEEEIKKHLMKLANSSEPCNIGMKTILEKALFNSDFDPYEIIEEYMETDEIADSYKRDVCLWLIGKFHKAPYYRPLREEQFSTEQVIEDFGQTNYTKFILS